MTGSRKAVKVLLSVFTQIRIWWKLLVILLVPFIYSPLLIVSNTVPAKAAYGILIIATYWVTDVAPIAATALLPIFIFPVLKVSFKQHFKTMIPKLFLSISVLSAV